MTQHLNPAGMPLGDRTRELTAEELALVAGGDLGSWFSSVGHDVGRLFDDVAKYGAVGSIFGPEGLALGAGVGATIGLLRIEKNAALNRYK